MLLQFPDLFFTLFLRYRHLDGVIYSTTTVQLDNNLTLTACQPAYTNHHEQNTSTPNYL